MSDGAPPQRTPSVNSGFSVSGRLKSIRHALAGLGFMLRTQHNAWLHLAATILAAAAGLALRIGANDWRWLVVAIVMVWVAEAMNTAFEHLCDVVAPQFHASVKLSKDIAAGAVLITALGAAVLGVLVFLPYLGL
ncbi:MAG TPA: diacylglycerol kinase family protein [Rhizomicrobium sp.]|jgi:diacylglycerol kinase (ATP)|nr:diacylglycerol kinase family protein [Rhizomicrobium sp.]